MRPEDFDRHVRVPVQCAMNSYLWRRSMRQWIRYVLRPNAIAAGAWRPPHFLLHMAGWNKVKVNFSILKVSLAFWTAVSFQWHVRFWSCTYPWVYEDLFFLMIIPSFVTIGNYTFTRKFLGLKQGGNYAGRTACATSRAVFCRYRCVSITRTGWE